MWITPTACRRRRLTGRSKRSMGLPFAAFGEEWADTGTNRETKAIEA